MGNLLSFCCSCFERDSEIVEGLLDNEDLESQVWLLDNQDSVSDNESEYRYQDQPNIVARIDELFQFLYEIETNNVSDNVSDDFSDNLSNGEEFEDDEIFSFE
jgi:hypothetical protein